MSNTWVTYLWVVNNSPKGGLIHHGLDKELSLEKWKWKRDFKYTLFLSIFLDLVLYPIKDIAIYSPRDRLAGYQLVGGVMAHQGDDP